MKDKKIKELIDMIQKMRDSQRKYFRTRNYKTLNAAKQLESEVDQWIRDYKDTQVSLSFDDKPDKTLKKILVPIEIKSHDDMPEESGIYLTSVGYQSFDKKYKTWSVIRNTKVWFKEMTKEEYLKYSE